MEELITEILFKLGNDLFIHIISVKLIFLSTLKIKFIIFISFFFLIASCWKQEVGRSYYEDGSIKTEASIRNGLLDGPSVMYFQNGLKMSEANYKNGLLNGLSISYYENGETKASASYRKGVLHGKSSKWKKNGTLIKEVNFNLGRLLN